MPTYTFAVNGVDIDVEFPFEAYPSQREYMHCVLRALCEGRNALLESPTGTGKTLCLLCACLAWQARVSPPPGVVVPAGQRSSGCTLLYASRTHSQLSQVLGELRNTAYRPRVAALGSRAQMCVHSRISTLSGAAQNSACRSAVSARKCMHHLAVEAFVRADALGPEPADIEELVSLGRSGGPGGCGPCPYYLSRELAKSASLVLLPYNYLIDPQMRRALGDVDWRNSVVVFDEAHNLESVCGDAASFDLSAATLAGAIGEANDCWEAAVAAEEGGAAAPDAPPAGEWRQLKVLLRLLEERIAAALSSCPPTFPRSVTHPPSFLASLLASISVTDDTAPLLTSLLRSGGDALSGSPPARAPRSLSDVADAVDVFFRSLADGSADASFVVHIRDGGDGKGPTLSYWCLRPGVAMAQLASTLRCCLLTSGTLAPLPSFASEIGVPFDIQLEARG